MGGAAIACIRHSEAMRAAGADSVVAVAEEHFGRPGVVCGVTGYGKLLHSAYRRLLARKDARLDALGNFGAMSYGHDFASMKEVREADAIFLHWVNNNTLSLKGVECILKLGKPVFWYMHDMFPITGGCHYSFDCQGFESDCKDCPLIRNTSEKSFAARQLLDKLRHWKKYRNLSFVTPSRWLGDLVRSSVLAEGHPVLNVPNVLDTDVYKPLNFSCKELFGLDPAKRTILFGAASLKSIYKGFADVRECLKGLDSSRYEGLVTGEPDPAVLEGIPMRIRTTGFLYDDLSLVMAYNASDAFIIASKAENYPNVVMEAMACGRPCIGYRTGGIPELIRHGESGFVTENNTPAELMRGIEYVFSSDAVYSALSGAARAQIEKNNSYSKVRSLHSELDWSLVK